MYKSLDFKHSRSALRLSSYIQESLFTGIAAPIIRHRARNDWHGWIPAHHAAGVMSGMTELEVLPRHLDTLIPRYLSPHSAAAFNLLIHVRDSINIAIVACGITIF